MEPPPIGVVAGQDQGQLSTGETAARQVVYLDPSDSPEVWYSKLYPNGADLPRDTDFTLLPTPPGTRPHTLHRGKGPFDGRVYVSNNSRLLGGQLNVLGDNGQPLLDGPAIVDPSGPLPRAVVAGAPTRIDATKLRGGFEAGKLNAIGTAELRGFEVDCGPRWDSKGNAIVCVDLGGSDVRVQDVNAVGGYESMRLHAGPALDARILIQRSTGIGAKEGFFVFVTDAQADQLPEGSSVSASLLSNVAVAPFDGVALHVWPMEVGSTASVFTENNTFVVGPEATESVNVMGGRDNFGEAAARDNYVFWESRSDTFGYRKAAIYGGLALGFGFFGEVYDNTVDALLVDPIFSGIVDLWDVHAGVTQGRFDLLVSGGFGLGGAARGNRVRVAVFGATPATAICDNANLCAPEWGFCGPAPTDNRVEIWGPGPWRNEATASWTLCVE